MFKRFCFAMVTMMLGAGAVDAANVYWAASSGHAVRVAPVDGTYSSFTSTASSGAGVGFDDQGWVYWTESTAALYRKKADGSAEQKLADGNFYDLDVDYVNRHVYMTRRTNDAQRGIYRYSLDSQQLTQIDASQSFAHYAGIAVDLDRNRLVFGGQSSFYAYDLTSGDVTSLVTAASSAWGVAVDPADGTIYWGEYSSGNIRAADADGSNIRTVLHGGVSTMGVALDYAGRIYWTRHNGGAYSANLDGSDVHRYDAGSGDSGLRFIEVDVLEDWQTVQPIPAPLAALAGGVVCMGGMMRRCGVGRTC